MPPRKRKNARAVKPEPADPAVSSEMQSIIDELEAEGEFFSMCCSYKPEKASQRCRAQRCEESSVCASLFAHGCVASAAVRQRTEELQAQKAELVRAGRLECLRLILGLPAEVNLLAQYACCAHMVLQRW